MNNDRINELVQLIQKYSAEYYFGSGSSITDAEFDELVNELSELDPSNKILNQLNYGVAKLTNSDDLPHRFQVEGLPKCYALNPSQDGETYNITPKYDGVSAIAYYTDGKLDYVATRGDGKSGTDITSRVSVPRSVDSNFTGAIRGEVLIPKSIFELEFRDSKNPRNSVAGLLSAKNPDQKLLDYLVVIFYDVYPADNDYKPIYQGKVPAFLRSLGIPDGMITKKYRRYEYQSLPTLLDQVRSEVYDYQLDGLVLTNKNYRFAFKVNDSIGVTSRVINIQWSKSGYGKYVPVIQIEPVEVGGVTVSKVSGNSYNYIIRNQIQIGSVVKVIRSGEVIPYIISVDNPDLEFSVLRCNLPSNFEIRGAHIYSKDTDYEEDRYLDGLIWRAAPKGVGGVIRKNFIAFIKSESIDLPSNSKLPRNVEKFLIMQRDGSSAHPYSGTPSECTKFATMLDTKLSVLDVLLSLSEEGVGYHKMMKLLATSTSKYNELSDYLVANYSDVLKVESNDNGSEVPIRLSVCITGKLSKPRSDLEKELRAKGVASVDIKKAEILICNDFFSQSSKAKYAREKGLLIMSEPEFIDYLDE